MKTFSSNVRAFTLIELLVVVGIIALIAGGLGLALRDNGNATAGLQSAQSTLSSLFSSMRGQAALKGGTAALFVSNEYSTSNKDRYLRYCVVATTPDNPVLPGSVWTAVNEGYYLPKGVYFLPPTVALLTGDAVEADVSFGALASNGFDRDALTVTLNSISESRLVLGINSLGQRVVVSGAMGGGNNGTNIVLSVANPQPPGATYPMKFSNASNVRGFSISQYGVGALINDASGFY